MGHWLDLAAARRVARRADAAGYCLILVDGQARSYPERAAVPGPGDAPPFEKGLEGLEQARIASIQLPSLWNARELAASLSSTQKAARAGTLGFFGVGDAQRADGRLTPGSRLRWLDRELESLREQLHALGARIPLMVAARGPRAMTLVERHADLWDANVAPMREALERARAHLSRRIETALWIFARPQHSWEEADRDYRRVSPWFADLSPDDTRNAVLWGEAERCRNRLAALRSELEIDLPVLDLAGLDEAGCVAALEALAPAKAREIA